MLNYGALREKKVTLNQLVEGLKRADLRRETDEMIDAMLEVLVGARDEDVIYQPEDADANDRFATNPDEEKIAWTLGHVVVHATASSEEAAALSAQLARGLEIKDRSRYEVPWREVTRVVQLRMRLEESRRMRQAFLNAWPDEPHLENLYAPPYPAGAEPITAVGRFVYGLVHDFSHLGQIKEIMRQARAARKPA